MEASLENFSEGAAVTESAAIAKSAGGRSILWRARMKLAEQVAAFVAEAKGKSLDLVLALDTTRSMEDNMPYSGAQHCPALRDGAVRALPGGPPRDRDDMEEYLTKILPFEAEFPVALQHPDAIRSVAAYIPEAVFEALYGAVHSYPWKPRIG